MWACAAPAPAAIDVGNAGTLLRLLPGWLAGQDGGAWTLDGDDSIRQRPVDRVAVPLREMGADLRCREERLPPLEIRGAPLRGIEYELPVASAQVKSCVLFAGLLAEGETRVVEPLPTRDHTERMLAAAGATGSSRFAGDERRRREPGRPARARRDRRSGRHLLRRLLHRRGAAGRRQRGGPRAGRDQPDPDRPADDPRADGRRDRDRTRGREGGEPIGDLRVRATDLRATEVGGAEVPLAIDELPLVALAACFAEGTTTIRDAAELRRKESDRDRHRQRRPERARR